MSNVKDGVYQRVISDGTLDTIIVKNSLMKENDEYVPLGSVAKLLAQSAEHFEKILSTFALPYAWVSNLKDE